MSATAASGRAERAARGAALLACVLALAACAAEDAPPPAAIVEQGAEQSAAEAGGVAPAGAATDGGTRRPPAAVAAAGGRPEDAAMAALAPDAGEREAPPGEQAPPDLMGLDAAALRALMGRPDFAWEQPGAAMWRYDGARCALFAFLHDGRVGHVEIHGDDAAWRAACLRRLLAQRP